MSVVDDIGSLGPQPSPPIRLSPFYDERGQPDHIVCQTPPRQQVSFGTGQKLRSDLPDFTLNNPDIVQN